MKSGKGAGKALGGVVAVFHRNVDDLGRALGQLLTGQGKSAHPDVIAQCKTAQNAEDPLKVERGGIGLLCHVL